MPPPPPLPADRLQAAFWIAFALACAWLLAVLAPILAPFLLAGILAYIANPVVDRLLPWLRESFGIRLKLDPASVRKLLGDNMDAVQMVLEKLYVSAKVGGSALLGFAVTAVLVPVVMFYLLLDWNVLLERIDQLVPRRWHGKTADLARRVDAVLSEYLRDRKSVV
jgi:predicted PurR-regulated permease PerM